MVTVMTINYEQLLKDIIIPIVLVPEKIEILVQTNDKNVDIKLFVDEKDLGRVIGRQGKTISAIRTILYSISAKDESRVSLEVDKK